MKKWGVAITADGCPNGKIVSWVEDDRGNPLLFASRDDALILNESRGWTGYVKEYEKNRM